MSNDIGNIIYDSYQAATNRKTSKSEINSGINSLQYMDRVPPDLLGEFVMAVISMERSAKTR
jgi:hypothetical protein